jgi:hypothetical protein
MVIWTGPRVSRLASWLPKPDTDDIQPYGTRTSFRLAFAACSFIRIIVIWVTVPAPCRFLYDPTTLSSPVWNGARLQKDRHRRGALQSPQKQAHLLGRCYRRHNTLTHHRPFAPPPSFIISQQENVAAFNTHFPHSFCNNTSDFLFFLNHFLGRHLTSYLVGITQISCYLGGIVGNGTRQELPTQQSLPG